MLLSHSSSIACSHINLVADTFIKYSICQSSPFLQDRRLVISIGVIKFGAINPIKLPLKLHKSRLARLCRPCLSRASEVAETRGAAAVGIEDLLFLMRRSPIRIQRLVKVRLTFFCRPNSLDLKLSRY